MHKLNRNSVDTPTCLKAPSADKCYADLRGHEKNEIRDRLLEMQGQRCAYCERRTGTDRHEGHIEHFRKQCNHGGLVLSWENLFWSCVDINSCGKHKDDCNIKHGTGVKREFKEDEIIDPAIEDPEHYFVFVSDGTVCLRDGLTTIEKKRAEETLRVFNLADSAFLRTSREDAVRPYKASIDSLLPHGIEMVQKYVDGVFNQIDTSPFCTAIKHYLGGLLQTKSH